MIEEIVIKQGEEVVETNKDPVITEIFDNLRRVFQAVQEYSKRVERETGLTGPQSWTMQVIAEKEPIKISDIARRMYLHVATVVGIVDRLEIRGFVRRIRDQKDRRVVYVALTEEGKSLIANSPQVARSLLLSRLEMLPNRKLKTVQSGFEIMAQILNGQNQPPKTLVTASVSEQETSCEESETAAVPVQQF